MSSMVYFWWGLALALMAAETFVPGAFLLWFGFAALAMGLIGLAWPEMPVLAQAVLFGVFCFISIYIYRRWFRGREPVSDQPLLNRRVEQMIGRTYALQEAIKDGYGKIRVNDALWTVQGTDMPAGARVVVTGADGLTLQVKAAD